MNRAFKTPRWTLVVEPCWHRAGVPSQPLGRCTRQLGESINARARTGRCRRCACPLPPLRQAHILPRNVVSTRKIFRIGSPPSRGRDPNRPVSPAPLSCPFHPRSPPSEPEDPSTREEMRSASNAPLFAFPAKKGGARVGTLAVSNPTSLSKPPSPVRIGGGFAYGYASTVLVGECRFLRLFCHTFDRFDAAGSP